MSSMKLTKTRTDKVIDLLGEGATVADACTAIGISVSGFYGLMNRDEEFKKAVYETKATVNEERMETYEQILLDNIQGSRRDDYNLLREFGHHTRWKAKVTMPEQYGENKSKSGVEVGTDGKVRIVWES